MVSVNDMQGINHSQPEELFDISSLCIDLGDNMESSFPNMTSVLDDWDTEKIINGDMAVIPSCSGVASMEYPCNSPPAAQMPSELNNIFGEVLHLGNEDKLINMCADLIDDRIPLAHFDPEVKPTSRGKKIDIEGQCYILDNNEKLSPHTDSSLSDDSSDDDEVFANKNVTIKLEQTSESSFNTGSAPVSLIKSEENEIVDVVSVVDDVALQAVDVETLLYKFEKTYDSFDSFHQQNSDTLKAQGLSGNAVTQDISKDLVQKMSKAAKRKEISIIEARPAKRKRTANKLEATRTAQQHHVLNAHYFSVTLDHSYCLPANGHEQPYVPNMGKDSGFQSEEEIQFTQSPAVHSRSILKCNVLKKQTLLSNAIAIKGIAPLESSAASADQCHKENLHVKTNEISRSKRRKLNLEEYKKRRDLLGSGSSSNNISPTNSGSCSPPSNNIEVYQRNIMEMAAAVLRATPKGSDQTLEEKPEQPIVSPAATTVTPIAPPNLEKKVLVSIGVNTIECKIAQIKELEDIKPILRKGQKLINSSSLISSVIENVKNKKIKNCKSAAVMTTEEEHGENKIIMWPEKNRQKNPTADIGTQTDSEAVGAIASPTGVRSEDESSITHHRALSRSRSKESLYSSSPSYSGYCSLSSRSPSPRSDSRGRGRHKAFNKERRHLTKEEDQIAAEERRILFVGGISRSTTARHLRNRFSKFGKIIDVKVYFPQNRDNYYGFVTFANRSDTYNAVEHGNDDRDLPQYNLNFGGRRDFCQEQYSDLDREPRTSANWHRNDDDSWDAALQRARELIEKKKKSA